MSNQSELERLKQNSTRGLPAWQLEIIRKYPAIYLEPSPENLALYKECPQNLDLDCYCNLRFGFEFNRGWAKLIDDLSKIATELVDALRSSGMQPDARISACIAKEKFGTLRWQGDDNLRHPFRTLWFSHIRWVQTLSGSCCERTGGYGELRDIGGRIVTLSQAEYDKEVKHQKSKGR